MATDIARRVHRARSNFYMAMRLMPAQQRAAMFAIYAFARALDDVADGPGSHDDKHHALDAWRDELARAYDCTATTPIGIALASAVKAYDLPRSEFEELILGMEMDLADEMHAPSLAMLDLYCRRVAGSIGFLALRVFGCDTPPERAFAMSLGAALQLTNIARDIEEDGARGRLYVPREILDAIDAGTIDPRRIGAHPRFGEIRDRVCALAGAAFAAAERALEECPSRRRLWPALAMMAIYRRVLSRVAAAPPGSGRVRVPSHVQLWTALRAMVLARS
jgi:presqualene diphosphate synthase